MFDSRTLLETADWHRLRYIGELDSDVDPVWHRGALCERNGSFTLGRYFPRTNPRHEEPLSQTILAGKNRQATDPILRQALEFFCENAAVQLRVDVVISVPPKKGETDRFASYRRVIAKALDAETARCLRSQRDPSNYKRLDHNERKRLNLGRFVADDAVSGLRILLLDDVVTSGATLESCREALSNAGAAEVFTLAFASTQRP